MTVACLYIYLSLLKLKLARNPLKCRKDRYTYIIHETNKMINFLYTKLMKCQIKSDRLGMKLFNILIYSEFFDLSPAYVCRVFD